MTRTRPRRQAPAPHLPQSRPTGPSSAKLLLRASHDLGEPVPFLPPGGIELFPTLEVNLVAELLNQCLERTIPCHALERCFQLLNDRLGNSLGGEYRSPLGEQDINALFAKRRNVGQIAKPPRIADREGADFSGAILGKQLSREEKATV